jgi:DNA adenine methylase
MQRVKFFKFYGAKTHLLKDIYNVILPLRDKITCFVDVFGGSGVVALNLPFKSNVIVYNDLDKWLYTTFKVIQNEEKRNKLIEKLEYAFKHRDIFNEFKESYKKEENLEDVEIAFRFIYLVQSSYNGDMSSYGITISEYRRVNEIIYPIHNLKLGYLLKGWIIENLDFKELMKKYDSETTFFYLDPPYLTGGKDYRLKFSIKDMEDLKQICDNLKGYYLLNESDKDFEEIKKLFGEPKFTKRYVNNFNARFMKKSYRLEGFWYNFTSQASLLF